MYFTVVYEQIFETVSSLRVSKKDGMCLPHSKVSKEGRGKGQSRLHCKLVFRLNESTESTSNSQ